MLITTHIDRQHIHNHFAVAAYDFDGKRWYDNKSTLQRCREISDKICAAHGLSIIEKPSYRANKKYSDWLARQQNVSWKTQLSNEIDRLVLRDDVKSVEDLAEQLRHSFSSASFFLRHIQYDFKLLYTILNSSNLFFILEK